MIRYCLGLIAAFWLAQTGSAHYTMLLPQTPMAMKGDKVAFLYQFGHPFEHELFDAPRPTKVEAKLPDGKMVDLTSKLEKFKKPGVDGKDVAAFRFNFTPEQRGDHWFILHTQSIWMEESKQFYRDVVQVVLHVQTQNGWDAPPLEPYRMVPLTRPYGILPGMAFQGKVVRPKEDLMLNKGIRPKSMVEIERYNPQRPKEIPPDELVTFKAVTNDGVFTCTLTEPGWWCMTTERDGGKEIHNAEEYPVRQRVTMWVHVDARPAGK
jgi:cobalt/nickel transport protein